MNRTKIEWARNPDGRPGYTWNPITGCLNHINGLCKGGNFPCYAYRLANGRLRSRYRQNFNIALPHETPKVAFDDPFYPRFWEERLKEIERPEYPFSTWSDNNASRTTPLEFLPINRHAKRKKVGIFVCDMSDLFGEGIPEEWTRQVLDAISKNGIDRFYLLTKQPQNLIKFSPFPENCWVGVTVCNDKMLDVAVDKLEDVQAGVKFISFEPLLERPTLSLDYALYYSGISWLIIGGCTGTYSDLWHLVRRLYPSKEEADFVRAMRIKELSKGRYALQPKIEWVKELVEAADRAGLKVFLKDNLAPLIKWPQDGPWAFQPASNMLRQEIPEI